MRWLGCCLMVLACVEMAAPARRAERVDLPMAGRASCASLAGTVWSMVSGDTLTFGLEAVEREAQVGVWQPRWGRCEMADGAVMVVFGEEAWHIWVLGRCDAVLYGEQGQRRELRRRSDSLPCHVDDAGLAGTRWQGRGEVTLDHGGLLTWSPHPARDDRWLALSGSVWLHREGSWHVWHALGACVRLEERHGERTLWRRVFPHCMGDGVATRGADEYKSKR